MINISPTECVTRPVFYFLSFVINQFSDKRGFIKLFNWNLYIDYKEKITMGGLREKEGKQVKLFKFLLQT